MKRGQPCGTAHSGIVFLQECRARHLNVLNVESTGLILPVVSPCLSSCFEIPKNNLVFPFKIAGNLGDDPRVYVTFRFWKSYES